ncbi:hypothetical protein HYS00_01760 [Candidatus Microgenomates bacterium]|nr:hypothetical protein [Candidatus Microgenomates bacterium]
MKLKTIILAAILALVFLIVTFFMISNSLKGKKGTGNTTVPIPEITRAAKTRAFQTLQKNNFVDAMTRLQPDERQRMQGFIATLPFTSNQFDMEYDAGLGVVLVAFKDPNAVDAFKAYLKSKNVLDVYLKGSSTFITTPQSIDRLRYLLHNEDTFEGDEETADSWMKSLPIRSQDYTASFDRTNKQFVFEFISVPDARVPAVRQDIIRRLTELNVPVSKYPIVDKH